MSDPSFVKLSPERDEGVLADPRSNWAISGRNVEPFPELRAEVAFVRRALSFGHLVAATEQEYDDAHPPYPFPITIVQSATEPGPADPNKTAFWLDTSDPFAVVVRRWVGDEWVAEADAPAPLPTGIYVQASAPASPSNGYLWIDTSGAPVAKIRNSGVWTTLEIPAPPEPGFELPEGLFVQAGQPSGSTDDIWFDTDNAEVRKFDGDEWVLLGEPGADLPEGLFVQSGEPADPAEGDIWFDTDDAVVSQYENDEWVTLELPTELPAGIVLAAEAPLDATEGDIWIEVGEGHTPPLVSFRRVGSNWFLLSTTVEVTQAAYDALTPTDNVIYAVIG